MDSALKKNISTIFKSSLKEDKVFSDITTKKLATSQKLQCEVVFKEKGLLCGKEVINYLLKIHYNKIKVIWKYNDGDFVNKGSVVATVTGPANKVLPIERIFLNFIQKMSGIATYTHECCKAIKNKKIKVLDTRKTTPGWRLIEKYCVRIGGGINHRMDLSEMILIKDNHIKTCGSITSALKKALANKPNIEIEVQSLLQLKEALKFKIKRIMLDNFTLNNTKKAIKIIRCFPKIEIEVSGGMNLPKLRKFSSLDIDFISIGSLTHSSKSIDISMNVKK